MFHTILSVFYEIAYNLFWFPLNALRAFFASPADLLSSGRKMFGFTLPGRVALLMFFVLLLCVGVSFAIWYFTPGATFWQAPLFKPWFVATICGLVVVIPIVLYFTIKVWLEGEATPFADIDHAWRAGMEELERNGLDVSQIPIFLVLGSSGEAQEKALFQAARISLNVTAVPPGPAALHWYANPDAIYLVASNVGGLSRLAAILERAAVNERSGAVAPRPARGGGELRGTIVVDNPDLSSSGAIEQPSTDSYVPPSDPGIQGTMVISQGTINLPSQAAMGVATAGARRSVVLPDDEAAEQDRRLEYLCSLLHRARRPICPINGILTMLPFGLLERGAQEGLLVQRTAKRDLATVVRVAKVRCPVTALVSGMECEAGFRELVRRVGRDRAAAQRFGKGFAITNPPLPERLEALCAHACGAFEDWVYTLFREKDALSKPGNTRLYSLLCNVRRNIQTRLGNILVDAYGADLDRDPETEYFFFSGCYFAATGETDDRQAFLRGVFDKLPQEQGELQWTEAAYLEDRKYRRLATLAVVYDLFAVAAIIGIFVVRYMNKG
jgi:hypothetical protein